MPRARAVVIAVRAAFILFLIAALLAIRPSSGFGWAVGVLVIAAATFASFAWLIPGYHRRIAPVWDEEFPRESRAHVTPGGLLEWEPRGAHRAQTRHGLVHRWWDLDGSPRWGAQLAFDIPDEVPAALLHAATRKGLAAATRALPGRGKVRAKAAGRDEPGPTSLVKIRLEVRGTGADEGWAQAAGEAFADAFLRALGRASFTATRR